MFISWILTIIAITGAIYNSMGNRNGFKWWLVSNSGFIVYNAIRGELAMAVLFGFYLVITINGLKTWKK